jgi:hypothetical protein
LLLVVTDLEAVHLVRAYNSHTSFSVSLCKCITVLCYVYIYAVYEAMESFSAESEDEVGFKAGDRIHVINKSMDGWWKIR